MNNEGTNNQVLQAVMELFDQMSKTEEQLTEKITNTEQRLTEKIDMVDAKISVLSDSLL